MPIEPRHILKGLLRRFHWRATTGKQTAIPTIYITATKAIIDIMIRRDGRYRMVFQLPVYFYSGAMGSDVAFVAVTAVEINLITGVIAVQAVTACIENIAAKHAGSTF